jgi:hypothetical protein
VRNGFKVCFHILRVPLHRGIQAGDPTRREKVYVGDVCVPVSKLAQCVSQTEVGLDVYA